MRPTRRALSPKVVVGQQQQVPLTSSAPADRPPSSQLRQRHLLPSKTIGALVSPSAAQYSSFTKDGCFPVAVTVRDPLLGAQSEMTRQLAQRSSKLARAEFLSSRKEAHDVCASELATLRQSAMSTLRPASALSVAQDDTSLNGDDFSFVVPVLRVETPIPGHPLARASSALRTKPPSQRFGSRPESADSTATGAGGAAEVTLLPKARRPMSWTVKKTPVTDPLSAPSAATPPLIVLNNLIRDSISRPSTAAQRPLATADSAFRPLKAFVY